MGDAPERDGALDATAAERPGARAISGAEPTVEAVGRLDADASTMLAAGDASDTPKPPGLSLVRPARRRIDIPGFRLLDILGEGGMGTVYAGEQDAPRRPVAIKVLHATSEAALQRFWAEAEIMARLDHPGIAKVLEAGEADGHPYFVMERVEGVTLDAHVRSESPLLAQKLLLFVALCDAIHHAHVKGVIHRDLKPSNVMVRDDGRVAVLDFGIARVAAADGSSGGETRAGELIGTPVYMSPEQARLRPDEVDARSDVYTLGVMLYELASGELPYDVRGKPLPDVSRAICEQPPRPMSKVSIALRGDLEAIADKALAKEPERRYQSAAALADDVRKHLEGGTISARVPGALEQIRRFARRRPGVAAAAIGAVLGGALFATVVTMLWLDARAARRAADRERARVAAARDELEERNNLLVLDQARTALVRDPSAALAALATLSERGTDPSVAWAIADEALGRGAASAVMRAHGDEARWIEGVPGGDALVSAGYDGRVLWFDRGGGGPREVAKLAGRAHVVRPSPDGKLLAIGGDAGVLRVVDSNGTEIAAPAGLPGDLGKIAWAPGGRGFAAGDDRGGVWLWSRDDNGKRLDGPKAEIEALEWSADGKVLVAGDDDGRVWSWDPAVADATLIGSLRSEVSAVWTDGGRVEALDAGGTLHRWHREGAAFVAEDEIISAIPLKTGAFSEDGAVAVLAAADGRVGTIVDGRTEVLGSHASQVRSVAVARRGDRIATGSDDGSLRVWDRAIHRTIELAGHTQRVRQLAFARGGDELLSADSAGELRRWDIAAIPATVFVGHRDPVERLALAPGGTSVISADAGGELWLWGLADGVGTRVGAHGSRVTGIAFAAGGGPVSAGSDGTVAFWRLSSTTPSRYPLGSSAIALAANSDGTRIAVATEKGSIALFDGDGAALFTLPGHEGGTESVAFSADGALLASGGQDRMVRVWTLAAPERAPLELGPAGDDIRHVRFTPDGAHLVATGDDGKVRAWEVRAGAVDQATERVLADHHTAVVALEIDAAGTTLLSTGRDHHTIATALAGGVPSSVAAAPEATPWLALRGDAPRYIVGRADGTILVRPASRRTFAELRAMLTTRGAGRP